MPRAFIACVAVVSAIALCAAPVGAAQVQSGCAVTIPTRKVPADAGFSAAGFNYGNGRLRAHLYWPRGLVAAGRLPDGGSMAVINPDGSIYLKLGWWRGVRGDLVIRGRRLDRPAPPLLGSTSNGSYGATGFQPSGLTFPTIGCWRVVGKVGSTSLAFVVRVTKLND